MQGGVLLLSRGVDKRDLTELQQRGLAKEGAVVGIWVLGGRFCHGKYLDSRCGCLLTAGPLEFSRQACAVTPGGGGGQVAMYVSTTTP